MYERIGNEYDGIISSVTGFGIFIELENTVEGMVHFRNLSDDYYEFDEENYIIVGQNTGKTYGLGQKVRIKVDNVNVNLREIDFSIISDGENE